MKSIIYTLLLAMFTLSSCQDSQKQEIPEFKFEQNEYIIQADDPIHDIVLNESGHTFEDLHNYYLDIKTSRSQDLNYDNLRRKIMAHMKIDGTLVEHKDQVIIEFYVKEIISMDFISDMGLLAVLLTRLKGHWPISKINSTAQKMYDRNVEYILDNFDDPNKLFEKQGHGLNRLKMISNLKE